MLISGIGRQFWGRHYIYLLQLQISILVRVFLELTIAPLLICNLLYEAFFGRLRPRLAMQKGFLLDSLSGNASRTNPLPRLQNLTPATYIATMMGYCMWLHTFNFDYVYMYFPRSEKNKGIKLRKMQSIPSRTLTRRSTIGHARIVLWWHLKVEL